jgi:RyR domain
LDDTLRRGIPVPYIPRPLDTTKIQLDKNLAELVEILAENAHETWASQRMRAGWRFGPHRNDEKKEHPCLVPYEELSEAQKEYDRKAVSETIKALMLLGYHVTKGPR